MEQFLATITWTPITVPNAVMEISQFVGNGFTVVSQPAAIDGQKELQISANQGDIVRFEMRVKADGYNTSEAVAFQAAVPAQPTLPAPEGVGVVITRL